MLDLIIALATFAFALIVAYGRFDLQSTYYIFGAIYAVAAGLLLGNQSEPRIRGYRLHLWIVGICACFVLMWCAAGNDSFSGQQTTDRSLASMATMILPRVALMYLGIYLASRASGHLSPLIGRLPIRFAAWLDIFLKTPTETFTAATLKVRAILFLVLFAAGVWAVITGDLPSGMSIVKDLAALFTGK